MSWSEDTVKRITDNIIELLKRYPRHFSASGIVGLLTKTRRPRPSPSPYVITMIMNKHVVGHNGIVGYVNDDGIYEYFYDSKMDLMHSARDLGGL